ncbi:MAG TPA: chemotaxis protein CheW [Gammaproteobacteria bacterium]|nr:chemotaxis protein CheW [Gammaproteobacteria bacterium]
MTNSDTALMQDKNEDTSQYLTFMLAGEEYGVEILRVQEIRGWEPPTDIPNTPDYVLGVINLRGTVVPIIDLRKRFDLENVEFGKTTVVVVVKVQHEKGERTMGLVVDAVSDVYDILPEQIRPSPDFGGVVSTEFVKGLAKINKNMIILLDLDLLINQGVLSEAGNV